MNTRQKLIVGIGVLFAMIVLLSIQAVDYVRDLSSDTSNILAANYNSLDYSKRMLAALDDWDSGSGTAEEFAKNLELQRKNVTEVDEQEATDRLARDFDRLKATPGDPAVVRDVREDLLAVMSLNMASIQRKSHVAERTAKGATFWLTLSGISCVGVAFILLILFPRAVARPVRELTEGILEISNRNYDKRLHFNGSREFRGVAESFNRMAETLSEYRRSTLEDILAGHRRLEAIVNAIHEPIIGLDGNRNILFVNNEALTVLNFRREDAVGKPAADVALRNDLLRRLVREMVRPGDRDEPLKIYADNKESYFQMEHIPLSVTDTGGGESHYVGDVILLKNITKFKELDSAKTNFISTVSHEMKTPLSAILMSLKLLDDSRVGEMNGEQRALAQSIRENSDRLLNITGELLKMTQVETGRLDLSPKVTKPIELIDYAVNATRVLVRRFGCNVEVEYPDGKMPKLFVDSEKIAWVVTNLLSNAIHYSPEGARVIVGAAHRPEAKIVDIFVQDFGKGIDPRYHKSIFDRYFRVPGTKVQGSGLGLAISKDFVEAHGGTVRVESEPGQGSRFTISLPLP